MSRTTDLGTARGRPPTGVRCGTSRTPRPAAPPAAADGRPLQQLHPLLVLDPLRLHLAIASPRASCCWACNTGRGSSSVDSITDTTSRWYSGDSRSNRFDRGQGANGHRQRLVEGEVQRQVPSVAQVHGRMLFHRVPVAAPPPRGARNASIDRAIALGGRATRCAGRPVPRRSTDGRAPLPEHVPHRGWITPSSIAGCPRCGAWKANCSRWARHQPFERAVRSHDTLPLRGLSLNALSALLGSSPACANARSLATTCSGAWHPHHVADRDRTRPGRPGRHPLELPRLQNAGWRVPSMGAMCGGEQHGADRYVDPHPEGVGAADHLQQPGLRQLLHQPPVAGQHAGVVHPDPVPHQAGQGAAEPGGEPGSRRSPWRWRPSPSA